MRRWIAVGPIVVSACTFGSATGGGAGSSDEGSDGGSGGSSSTAGVTSSTPPATGSESDGGPPPATDSGPATSTGAGDTGPSMEICNQIDDDGDGAVDEFSPENPECGPCRYVVDPTATWVYSFCDDATTQILAGLNCEVKGATLTSIGDDATNDLLFDEKANGEAYFIGYTDDMMEGTWYWTDGAPLEYENWAFGEPNDAGDGQDCAVMRDYSSTWDDVACDIPHRYICRGPL